VPKKPKAARPLYRRKPPEKSQEDYARAKIIPSSHFQLREDGTIAAPHPDPLPTGEGKAAAPHSKIRQSPYRRQTAENSPSPGGEGRDEGEQTIPALIYSSDSPFVRLYQGNCLELLDAIYDKYGDAGRFDAIFADPPYFLSNGGITCHAGRMVKVDKGDWDISRGAELNHEFNREWLKRCQRVLKPNGTIWVSGTHHVIFSIGYAMQQLGYKILNDIAWEKPNPPPNLSCRYFTHSTETILWAAKNEDSKHRFNYAEMKAVTGKQMKTVWRDLDCGGTTPPSSTRHVASKQSADMSAHSKGPALESIWTLTAPGGDEKEHGKHPTQKPVALIERCLLASTNEGDLVLDPFLGGGTTAIAAIKLKRGCIGIELDFSHLALACKRSEREIIEIVLRSLRVRIEVSVFSQNDLDLFSNSINGSRVDDKPEPPTERIFHECKFMFLSCAQVERGAVVHTTVDVSLQEAWAKTPNGKKRETTHVVRCETEIFRVKSS
jgi:site-specific DNA-methyltransferase (adenine-specific)